MGKVIMSGIVPQLILPVSITGTPINEIAEGSTIYLMEGSSKVEFYVAKHDYESGLNGTGRTLLARKNCLTARSWDSTNNSYADSDISAYLNGTYYDKFSDEVKAAMATTKFYYIPGNGTYSVSTLERAIFLPSLREYGYSNYSGATEGTALPIAETIKAQVTSSGCQWTRTPLSGANSAGNYNNQRVYLVHAESGYTLGVSSNACNANTYEFRPMFTIPAANVFIKDDGTLKFK